MGPALTVGNRRYKIKGPYSTIEEHRTHLSLARENVLEQTLTPESLFSCHAESPPSSYSQMYSPCTREADEEEEEWKQREKEKLYLKEQDLTNSN